MEDNEMDGILDDKEQIEIYETLIEIHEKAIEKIKERDLTESDKKLIKLRQKSIEYYLDVIRQKKEQIVNQE